MNAKVIKAKLLFELLYQRGYHMAVTEKAMSFGIADVYAMTKAGYTHEFEVKVSKQDLKSELECIELLKTGVKQEKYFAKMHKHRAYMHNSIGSQYSLFDKEIAIRHEVYSMLPDSVPNKFSFAVPQELEEYALSILAGTPYGLFVITERGSKVPKDPTYLHKDKISEKEKMQLLRKVSTEIQILRAREAGLDTQYGA